MRIADILDVRGVVLELSGGSKREILATLAQAVAQTRTDIDVAQLLEVWVKREDASSTAIADGIAIPHGKIALGEEVIAVFGRSRNGLDFGSVDGRPSTIFFALVSPEAHPSLHLRWLAHIASLLKGETFRQALLQADTASDVLAAIATEERAQAAER